MHILPYSEQLAMLAREHKVEMLDAVKHAGLPTTTYYRSVIGGMQLSLYSAQRIAEGIIALSKGAGSCH